MVSEVVGWLSGTLLECLVKYKNRPHYQKEMVVFMLSMYVLYVTNCLSMNRKRNACTEFKLFKPDSSCDNYEGRNVL